MKQRKTIVLPCAYFCAWNGGVKLIKMCLDSLIYYDKKREFNYVLLIPDNNFLSALKRFNYILKSFFFNIFSGKIAIQEWPYYKGAQELRNFFSNEKCVKILGVDYRHEKYFINNNDISFLSMSLSPKGKKIGYIFDFQHKYLKKFFSKSQRIDRDKFFKKIIKTNKLVIVNSHETKKDIFKYFKKTITKVVVLPFLPFLNFELKNLGKKIIKDDYFIICNQYWSHKNFETAIKAFKKFKYSRFKLIITGQLTNKNKQYYFSIKKLIERNGLQNKVILFSNLEKNAQLNLIYNSKALIQPSLFEGGPGGFSVYEAISFNKPILVSDIKVNKEINYNKVFYFKANSYIDLSKKIERIYKEKFKKISRNNLIKYSNKNKYLFGKFLFRLINNNYQKI